MSDSMEGSNAAGRKNSNDVPTMEELVEEAKVVNNQRDRTGSDLGLAL